MADRIFDPEFAPHVPLRHPDAPRSAVLIDIDGVLTPVCAAEQDAEGQVLLPRRPEPGYIIEGAVYHHAEEARGAGGGGAGSGFTTQHVIDLLQWLGDPEVQRAHAFDAFSHSAWREQSSDFWEAFGLVAPPQFATHEQYLNRRRDHDPRSWWKSEAVLEWLTDPVNDGACVVWIDDDLTEAERQSLRSRLGRKLAPRLIAVQPDTFLGLTPQEARMIRAMLMI